MLKNNFFNKIAKSFLNLIQFLNLGKEREVERIFQNRFIILNLNF